MNSEKFSSPLKKLADVKWQKTCPTMIKMASKNQDMCAIYLHKKQENWVKSRPKTPVYLALCNFSR